MPLLDRQTGHRGLLHTSAFPINMQNVMISRQTCLLSPLPADSCEARSSGPGRAEPLAAAGASGGQEAPPPLVTAVHGAKPLRRLVRGQGGGILEVGPVLGYKTQARIPGRL